MNIEKTCLCCSGQIKSLDKRSKFCSHKCAAIINNRKRKKQRGNCKNCGKELLYKHSKSFCSKLCGGNYRTKEIVDIIEKGCYTNKGCNNHLLRRYLISNRGKQCEKCKLKTWLDQEIPLNIHHKDGNACNNNLENLELLCLNCHGITDNFGRKNKNSTRDYRYKNKS